MYKRLLSIVSLLCFCSLPLNANAMTLENTNDVRVVMVGDDLLHKPVYTQSKHVDGTYNLEPVFENMVEDISSADIAIINQETIFINDSSKYSSYPCFGSPETTGDAIAKAGFDVVCHATNHSADKGTQGIIDTCNFWDTKYPDIIRLGIHKSPDESDVAFMEKNGITFSFVNYTYGLNGLDGKIKNMPYSVDMLSNEDIVQTLPYAKDNSDVCIAILHAGNEYTYTPTEYQKNQINKFIDLGADVVICMHPHVIEPFGIITTPSGNTGLVYYSLGNFVSAQNEVPRVLGGMADFTVSKTIENGLETIKISNYDMVPLICHQESNLYTVYKLSEYPADKEARHKLRSKGFSTEKVLNLYNEITSKNPPIAELIISEQETDTKPLLEYINY